MRSMALFRVVSRGMDQSMTPVWRWYRMTNSSSNAHVISSRKRFKSRSMLGFKMEPNASNAAESKA